MKAVGIKNGTSQVKPYGFFDFEKTTPLVEGHDVLIKNKAISVNPIDLKTRQNEDRTAEEEPRILGWDGSGIIVALGSEVTDFKLGDAVYYAGSFQRAGSYSSHTVVAEDLLAHKPERLSHEEAAALPLTSLTAYELLFDRMGLSRHIEDNFDRTLLIINAAGGVGSIATQLAKNAGFTVIGTASRPESKKWAKQMGVDYVISHHEALGPQIKASIGKAEVDAILCLHSTDQHFPAMTELIRPEGKIGLIVTPNSPIDIAPLQRKSVGIYWEWMFTRAFFDQSTQNRQGQILEIIAALIDAGHLNPTLHDVYPPLSAASIAAAHEFLASQSAIGKLVLPVSN